MRPSVAHNPDPLDVEQLPSADGMELDYRTEPVPLSRNAIHTGWGMLIAASAAAAATLVIRLTTAYTTSTLFLPIILPLGVGAALWGYANEKPKSFIYAAVLLGPLVWFLGAVAGTDEQKSLYLRFYAASFVVTLYLAHLLVEHYAFWMHANPRLDRQTRDAWHRTWKGRPWRVDIAPDPNRLRACDEREAPERLRYYLTLAFVGLVYAVGYTVLARASVPALAGLWAILLTIAVLLTFGLLNCVTYGPLTVSAFMTAMLVFGRAVISWATYNYHGTRAPGVFRSPTGPWLTRLILSGTALLLLYLAALPLAGYCPVVLWTTGPEPWVRAAGYDWFWEPAVRNWRHPFSVSPQRPEEIQARLEPHQKLYLERLPASLRPAYLQQLAAQRTAAPSSGGADQRQVEAARALRAYPDAWINPMFRGIQAREPLFLWSLLASTLACVILPLLLALSMVFAVGSRVLFHHYLGLEAPDAVYAAASLPAPSHRPMPDWQAYARRLQESQHALPCSDAPTPSPEPPSDSASPPADQSPPESANNDVLRESDHLWLGVNPQADYPVLLHRNILHEHAHITGDTGSGKTSLGLMPLIVPLIRRGDCSVLIIDLKGDMALFETARLEAEERFGPGGFRWFTDASSKPTYVFNPITQSFMADLTAHQRAEVLLQSLGLEHGEAYGRSFYSRNNRAVLAALMSNPEADSFRRLQQYAANKLTGGATAKQMEDAGEVLSAIDSLASFDALNVTASHVKQRLVSPEALDRRIDLPDLFVRPQVLYFYLESTLQVAAAREIAKLAFYGLLPSAVVHRHRGVKTRRVYVVVDEFQQIVSENLEILLRQARSMGIAAILANQTLADLKTAGVDIIPAIQANTRFKQVFAATDLYQQDALIKASGEIMHHMYSTRESASDISVTTSEQIGPRFRRNDIIRLTDREKYSIVQISRGSGYTRFEGFSFPLRSDYHITAGQHKKRSETPWPAQQPGTMSPPLPTGHEPPPAAPPRTPQNNPVIAVEVHDTRQHAPSKKPKRKTAPSDSEESHDERKS